MARVTELVFEQPERGYRFTGDSLRLVEFAASGRHARTLVDLGAGVGVIGLSLLARGVAEVGVFVERDPEQAARCRRNLERNGLTGTVRTVDVADVADTFDLVVCNPPYYEPGEGRASPDPGRTRARVGDIDGFARAAARACDPRGRVCFVYPAASSLRLLGSLQAAGLEPKRLAWVHHLTGEPARLLLVEARRGRPGGLVVEPTVIEQL